MKTKYSHRPRGFTLIEVLIVIGIIGVLISIMAPALSAARERGRQAVCMNNLRSIWTGILSYATVHDERVPYLEDINLTDPNADPFDKSYPTTVGVVLESFVTEGSWRCPSAVDGFPRSGGSGRWKMTYYFSTAGPVGQGMPFDRYPEAGTRGPLDPAVSNYVQFDGRPLKVLDGRRYIQNSSANANFSRTHNLWWNIRWPLIRDSFKEREQPSYFSPRYPHRAALEGRTDLGGYRSTFEQLTNSRAARTGFLGLFADGEQVDLLMTREPARQHPPGY
ncbi:MAG TPA: prepilin-type N-terminal cleavage/methylation domain-containing protein [Phycisphaerae bacterium]|nr:prepilin-type N-terminal cleavage/methylation domain-containing protein [Phycisphaerae bacterium]